MAAAMETILYSLLAGDAAIAAIVGTRIYPNFIPQDADLPALIYQQISGYRHHTNAGALGLAVPRVQINCWAVTYAAADDLADKVRIKLDGYSGTVSSTKVFSILLSDEVDAPVITGAVTRYCKSLDFEISIEE